MTDGITLTESIPFILHCGDCLEVMKGIPDGSVDLVLTDPPYGTMKGAALDGWEADRCEWDNAINPADIFAACSRILRQNGKLILFSQEPYTSRLITEQAASLPFSYRAVWVKNVHANALLAKKAMVNRYEDICIFQKIHDAEGKHPLREYFGRVMEFIGKPKRDLIDELGQKADHCFRANSTQFSLCTEQTYNELIMQFGIREMDGFMPFAELKRIDAQHAQHAQSRFNLWQGGKSKSNVLEYAKDRGGYHPTQKPVALLEDLIQTFSNPGETVLDFTMGSGSTGVACMNMDRRFIGIEKDSRYFEIAQRRIETAYNTRSKNPR